MPSITDNWLYNLFFLFRIHFLQVEYYFQDLLSPELTSHHQDPKADVKNQIDENAVLIMNRSMLREIFLYKSNPKP